MNATEQADLINDILASRRGWTVTSDTLGRSGARCVDAIRIVDGVCRCVAELREGYRREYDASRDYWTKVPTGKWDAPYLRSCFAPGVCH